MNGKEGKIQCCLDRVINTTDLLASVLIKYLLKPPENFNIMSNVSFNRCKDDYCNRFCSIKLSFLL